MEVFGGVIILAKCAPNRKLQKRKILQENALAKFEKILDELVPKYGTPQINLEGSGEPTMAKDLFEYVKIVKKKDLNVLCTVMVHV